MTVRINDTALALALRQQDAQHYYQALQAALSEHFTIKLLTFTQIDYDNMQAKRLYSSDDGNYAIGGFKPIETNDWTTCVLEQQQVFVAHKHSELAKVFFDHQLIAEMGLGSVINWPVIVNNQVIGTVNMLAQEHAYVNFKPQVLEKLTPWLTLSFLIKSSCKD